MADTVHDAHHSTTHIKFETFQEVLQNLTGKVVTVVSAESFRETDGEVVLEAGSYRAKILGVGSDYLSLATEYARDAGATVEPVRQFIPLGRIKRISILKGERLLHL